MSIEADPELVKELFGDVIFHALVELGRTSFSVQDMLSWGPGSIIKINKTSGEPVDILVHGKPLAFGEMMVLDDRFAVRVTEILNDEILTLKSKDGLYVYR